MKRLLFAAILALPVAAAPAPAHAEMPGLSVPQALAAALPPPAEEASRVTVRRTVLVQRDTVRLGDVFIAGEGRLPQADTVIARAPDAGRSLVLNAAWLADTARAHGLQWRASTGNETVTVHRDSRMVGREEIIAAVRDVLVHSGVAADAELDLAGLVAPLPVPAGTRQPVGVVDIDYDPRSGRFSTLIEIPAGAPDADRLRLSGRAHEVLEVPVLARAIARGQQVTADDVRWAKVRTSSLPAGVATDLDQVLRMTARRPLQAGQPLRQRDLERPALVEKNQLVTMVLRAGKMTLTAQGRAMERGAKGDVVRVQNTMSNQIVHATVTKDRTVVVQSADQTAALR